MHLRWVDFFVLRGDKDRCDSDQMQITFFAFDCREVAITDLHSHKESLRQQAELALNIDNPLNEESARGVLDVSLHFFEIARIHHVLTLFLAHHGENVLGKFCCVLRVAKRKLVSSM